ncbi:MAG: TlpA disulfide reductase family protein [Acidimicrobiia bacterium]
MSRSQRARTTRKQAEKAERARMTRRNKTIRAAVIGVAAAGIFVVAFFSLGGTGTALTGDTGATTWDLPGLADTEERIALVDFAGKPTVAAFFASWCTVCEAEMPGFAALSDQLGDQVNWVGINTQDNGAGLDKAREWGIASRWPLARDIGGTTGSDLSTGTFGIRGSPLTVVYDESGGIVHVQRGGMTAEQLLGLLEQAFGVSG